VLNAEAGSEARSGEAGECNDVGVNTRLPSLPDANKMKNII
jgi:hypothetical protein